MVVLRSYCYWGCCGDCGDFIPLIPPVILNFLSHVFFHPSIHSFTRNYLYLLFLLHIYGAGCFCFLLSLCFQLLIRSLLSLYDMVWRWRGTTWDVYFLLSYCLVLLRLLWLLYMVSLVVVVDSGL
ncbi:hypothetical protein BGX38DRAFT_93591 [Terfezia claveryi]|nr:hypothetical protein BGX38DRAFT_93591 [Terfezia claveryi]